MLFGDSHAAQWLPALTVLALRHHWRVVARTKSSAVWLTSSHRPQSQTALHQCDDWRRATVAEISRIAPALVVMSSIFSAATLATPTDDPEQAWAEGWRRTFAAVRTEATRAVFLVDTPYIGHDMPDCAATHPGQLTRCAPTRQAALLEPGRRAAVAGIATAAGASVIDVNNVVCADVCPVAIGNLLVWRDAHHLTTVYSAALVPILDGPITQALGGP